MIEAVEAHLNESGISPTTFGRDVMGDPNFVFELRAGRDVRGSTALRVLEHIETNKQNNNPSTDTPLTEVSS